MSVRQLEVPSDGTLRAVWIFQKTYVARQLEARKIRELKHKFKENFFGLIRRFRSQRKLNLLAAYRYHTSIMGLGYLLTGRPALACQLAQFTTDPRSESLEPLWPIHDLVRLQDYLAARLYPPPGFATLVPCETKSLMDMIGRNFLTLERDKAALGDRVTALLAELSSKDSELKALRQARADLDLLEASTSKIISQLKTENLELKRRYEEISERTVRELKARAFEYDKLLVTYNAFMDHAASDRNEQLATIAALRPQAALAAQRLVLLQQLTGVLAPLNTGAPGGFVHSCYDSLARRHGRGCYDSIMFCDDKLCQVIRSQVSPAIRTLLTARALEVGDNRHFHGYPSAAGLLAQAPL